MSKHAPLGEKQSAYIQKSRTSWLNVAEGGKRAGKNVINLLAWFMALENHPDKLHMAAGVSLSAAKMNILDSNGLGLSYLYRGRCRPGQFQGKDALHVQTKTGEKIIIFAGGGKVNNTALIKGNSYGTVYVTEVNECHPSFVRECFDRTLASGDRKLFFDLNPKPPGHWFYAEILDHQDALLKQGLNLGYNYGHFTIWDNHSISTDKLNAEVDKYDKSSIWYIADILGKRTSASGRIYTSYKYDEVAVSREWIGDHRNQIGEVGVGVDVGGTAATCATFTGIFRDHSKVVLLDGFYHEQKRENGLDEATYAKMIVQWLLPLVQAYPSRLTTIYVDSAAKLFRQALQNALGRVGLQRVTVMGTDKKDGINQRIQLTMALMSQGRFKVASHMAKWHEAYQSAAWDADKYADREWVRVDDGSYPVDALDSSEYSFYPFKRFLVGEI